MSLGSGATFGAAIAGASALTPVAIAALATVVVVVAVSTAVKYSKSKSKNKSKQKSKEEVDPYARAGQKKQGRETKVKARQSDKFKSRNNRRDGKPAKPKSHTPSRKGHTKYWP